MNIINKSKITKILNFNLKLIVLSSLLFSQLSLSEIFLYQNNPDNSYVKTAKADASEYSVWAGLDTYTVNNHPGAGYQALFPLTWKTGINADFSDIRFSDGSGNIIPYWIESKTDGLTASVWIKLTASGIVNLHYGKVDATSESNINNVMEFADLFNGVSLDGTKWSGSATVSNGLMTMGGANQNISSISTWGRGYEIITRYRSNLSIGSYSGMTVGFLHPNFDNEVTLSRYSENAKSAITSRANGVSWPATGTALDVANDNNYHNIRIYYGSPIAVTWDGVVKTRSSDIPNVPIRLMISSEAGVTSLEMDYIAIRKLNGTNPTFIIDTTPPTISAGSNQTKNSIFSQTATATDTGSDINASTYQWARVSGPGTLTFGSADSLATSISASQEGTYVISFTASDNATNSASANFTLIWDITAPTISGAAEGGLYNTNKTITFSDNLTTPTATLNDAVFTSGTTISTDGTYTLIVTDGATNSTTIHFTIDKAAPTSPTATPPQGTYATGQAAL